jgi:hypothetical protein
MKFYLIDASAYIYAVENLNKIKLNFFAEKGTGQAFLYIPQFCITEVFNAFARKFYRDKNIGNDLYQQWRNKFIQAIQNRTLVYCYNLHRYHNLNAHEVYKVEHTTPYSEKEHSLSAFDILIIAMGMELKKIHAPDEVTILTRDGRLQHISNLKDNFAHAVWFE